ncbi:MAG: DEAD/DEAH box helicase family protein, partial [Gaiellaceae bacterium]
DARLRVITSTYMGVTERGALDYLVRELGAEVSVNYEQNATRLHAKAWLLRRDTGFDTAYVGSSNLSRAAILDGLEWNVRLSATATPRLLDKFEATFEAYWAGETFEPYDPDRDGARFDEASRRAGASGTAASLFDVPALVPHPYPHQREILEDLDVQRLMHGLHRNLVVAATGTGKTVVAAFDYRNLRERLGGSPSLLFVAHRQEILEQSLSAFRQVLADREFGELHVGQHKATLWRHVFASVQSLGVRGIEAFAPDHFDVVVIDEFHHAAAPTYRRIIDYLRPTELLGLTATPERADGVRVQDEYFDGRVASEMRLWEALEADLLCPFHYFGITDETDLT